MPPKPFNPPRLSTSSSSATKAKGLPKGTSNKSNGISSSISGIKKKSTLSNGIGSKGNGKENEKRMSGERSRLSAASVRSLLPSLSPDSGDEDLVGVESQSDDPSSSTPHASTSTSKPRARKPEKDLEEEGEGDEARKGGRKERIPDALLTVILHEMFKEDGTRISGDANKAVGKYLDTFIREAVARAAWAAEDGGGSVLEVEDLERLAPQLLLDF